MQFFRMLQFNGPDNTKSVFICFYRHVTLQYCQHIGRHDVKSVSEQSFEWDTYCPSQTVTPGSQLEFHLRLQLDTKMHARADISCCSTSTESDLCICEEAHDFWIAPNSACPFETGRVATDQLASNWNGIGTHYIPFLYPSDPPSK